MHDNIRKIDDIHFDNEESIHMSSRYHEETNWLSQLVREDL